MLAKTMHTQNAAHNEWELSGHRYTIRNAHITGS